jgi:uncharacterized protein (TIGR02145 family)
MKKQLLIICLLAWLLGTSKAQTYSNCPGDSIKLKLLTYTGSLQWQESTDSVNWSNISGATYQPYGFVFASTKFYRAMVTANGCNPSYSAVQKVVNNTNCVGQYPAGTVHCGGTPTAIVEVTSPTGKTWMDRNLGASQVATDRTDANAYGDLYQWGRKADGHQCRNSATTSTLSSTDQPGNSSFILNSTTPKDWRSPQNTNLWQGVNGVNNPCPTGYRLPTATEWTAEDAAFDVQNDWGAFLSPLKLPLSGTRGIGNGTLNNVGYGGSYWSSTVSSTSSRNLSFDMSNVGMGTINRAYGLTVRCLKD